MPLLWILLVCGVGTCLGQTTPCGTPTVQPATTKRIVGGKIAVPGSWPWTVMISDSLDFISGGGAIIHPNVIMTSAQHFRGDAYNESTINLPNWKFYLGEYNISSDDPHEKVYRARSVAIHEAFNVNTNVNDIALVFLTETITFNDHTRPVCLPSAAPAVGTMCYLAGWGSTSNTGNEEVMSQVNLPVQPNSLCQQHYTDFLPGKELCVGYENGHKDFCADDIGDPLSCLGSDGKWYAQGIASSGGDCSTADEPGVYENVASYVPWIKRTMQRHSYTYAATYNVG